MAGTSNNPFFFRELSPGDPFCDREKELRDLTAFARSSAAVVLYSPRRHGKTSLVKRVMAGLAEEGWLTAYCDLFGVLDADEAARKIARALFEVTRSDEPLFRKAMRALRAFRPVLTPEPDGGVSVGVRQVGEETGLDLLEATLRSLKELADELDNRVLIVLDEFQEITELDRPLAVEAALRRQIQTIRAGFFFVGSRRRILLEMFNDRRRPFFQSAVNYALPALPRDELIRFLMERFARGGRVLPADEAGSLVEMTRAHPYYCQKAAHFLFEATDRQVGPGQAQAAMEALLASEKNVFEAILQGLSRGQVALLRSLAVEPTDSPYAAGYLARRGLGSTGGVQNSLLKLARLDLIEKIGKTWQLVDPVFRTWLARLDS